MKQLLLIIFLSSFFLAIGQQRDTLPSPTLSKQQLLSKSKSQKTVGWILTGTGIPLVAGSLYCALAFDKNDIDKGTVTAVLVASSLYTLAGILLVRAGNKNKERSLSLALNTNRLLLPSLSKAVYLLQPGLTLRLSFP